MENDFKFNNKKQMKNNHGDTEDTERKSERNPKRSPLFFSLRSLCLRGYILFK